MKAIKMGIKDRLIRKLLAPPVKALGAQYSMIFSAHDDNSFPSDYLIQTALTSIQNAAQVNLKEVSQRLKTPPDYLSVWPGEHYKLLAGIVLTLKPKLIIEIGTGAGWSALSLLKYLPPSGKVITFDLLDWQRNPETILLASDFLSPRLIQYQDDLSTPAGFAKHKELLAAADMIFIDAAKDGSLEKKLLDSFATLTFKSNPLLVFDDIRLWNMLKIWREITYPKLDLTSFGHWSGTGLVEWKSRP